MNYTDVKTKKNKEFIVQKDVSLNGEIDFLKYVSEMVVSNELGYMPILKDTFFDYAILQYYTNIAVFEENNQFSLDELEEFLKINKNVIDSIKNEIGIEKVEYLNDCCDELIKFRCTHFDNYVSDIAELLDVVRELVVKPDYMDELLKAVTEWVNTTANEKIDVNALTKFAEIIPMMQKMGSVEVAKAILKEKNNLDEK